METEDKLGHTLARIVDRSAGSVCAGGRRGVRWRIDIRLETYTSTSFTPGVRGFKATMLLDFPYPGGFMGWSPPAGKGP